MNESNVARDGGVPEADILLRAVADMKREILRDMGSDDGVKRMPINIADFSALHDYTDANTYAGFCDEGNPRSDWDTEALATVQEIVDVWITSGAARRERLREGARTENSNTMENIRCPECGQEEALHVMALVDTTLTDTGADYGDTDIRPDAKATCPECFYSATYIDFDISHQQQSVRLPYLLLGELRAATAHLPDEVPVTVGVDDWYRNVEMDPAGIPTEWPTQDHISLVLNSTTDVDTRQW